MIWILPCFIAFFISVFILMIIDLKISPHTTDDPLSALIIGILITLIIGFSILLWTLIT